MLPLRQIAPHAGLTYKPQSNPVQVDDKNGSDPVIWSLLRDPTVKPNDEDILPKLWKAVQAMRADKHVQSVFDQSLDFKNEADTCASVMAKSDITLLFSRRRAGKTSLIPYLACSAPRIYTNETYGQQPAPFLFDSDADFKTSSKFMIVVGSANAAASLGQRMNKYFRESLQVNCHLTLSGQEMRENLIQNKAAVPPNKSIGWFMKSDNSRSVSSIHGIIVTPDVAVELIEYGTFGSVFIDAFDSIDSSADVVSVISRCMGLMSVTGKERRLGRLVILGNEIDDGDDIANGLKYRFDNTRGCRLVTSVASLSIRATLPQPNPEATTMFNPADYDDLRQLGFSNPPDTLMQDINSSQSVCKMLTKMTKSYNNKSVDTFLECELRGGFGYAPFRMHMCLLKQFVDWYLKQEQLRVKNSFDGVAGDIVIVCGTRAAVSAIGSHVGNGEGVKLYPPGGGKGDTFLRTTKITSPYIWYPACDTHRPVQVRADVAKLPFVTKGRVVITTYDMIGTLNLEQQKIAAVFACSSRQTPSQYTSSGLQKPNDVLADRSDIERARSRLGRNAENGSTFYFCGTPKLCQQQLQGTMDSRLSRALDIINMRDFLYQNAEFGDGVRPVPIFVHPEEAAMLRDARKMGLIRNTNQRPLRLVDNFKRLMSLFPGVSPTIATIIVLSVKFGVAAHGLMLAALVKTSFRIRQQASAFSGQTDDMGEQTYQHPLVDIFQLGLEAVLELEQCTVAHPGWDSEIIQECDIFVAYAKAAGFDASKMQGKADCEGNIARSNNTVWSGYWAEQADQLPDAQRAQHASFFPKPIDAAQFRKDITDLWIKEEGRDMTFGALKEFSRILYNSGISDVRDIFNDPDYNVHCPYPDQGILDGEGQAILSGIIAMASARCGRWTGVHWFKNLNSTRKRSLKPAVYEVFKSLPSFAGAGPRVSEMDLVGGWAISSQKPEDKKKEDNFLFGIYFETDEFAGERFVCPILRIRPMQMAQLMNMFGDPISYLPGNAGSPHTITVKLVASHVMDGDITFSTSQSTATHIMSTRRHLRGLLNRALARDGSAFDDDDARLLHYAWTLSN